jgi:hypothetical protein
MAEIKAQIQYTPEDLQEAYKAHLFSYHPIRTRLLLFVGVLCIVYSVFLVVLSLVRAESFSITLGVSFLIYGMAMVLYYRWKINRTGKTIYKKLDQFKSPMIYNISDAEVHTIIGNGATANIPWNSFVKALITKDAVLLYPNQTNFLLFPAVHFNSSDFEMLKNLVRSKVADVLEK